MWPSRPSGSRARAGARLGASLVGTALFLATSAPAQIVIQPGTSRTLRPQHAICVKTSGVNPPDTVPGALAEAACPTVSSSGETEVFVSSGRTIRSVHGTAKVWFEGRFQVGNAPTEDAASLVPIYIRVPVDWTALFVNTYVLPELNRVVADFNIILRLRKLPPGNADSRGTVIAEDRLVGASHAGASGCITMTKSKVRAATSLASCVTNLVVRERGSSVGEISTLVEVGVSYNLELEVEVNVAHLATPGVGPTGADVGSDGLSPVMNWSRMQIAVGTDPRDLVADLQRQIDELREDLENHTHVYLTGRGLGHNNTEAVSSPATIPD